MLFSCGNKSIFTVYSSDMNKHKIQLNEKNTLNVITVYSSCHDCVLDLIEKFGDTTNMSIIHVVQKNNFAIHNVLEMYKPYKKNGVDIFFQFYKRKRVNSYNINNRIYRYFDIIHSPIIVFPGKNNYSTITYNELMDNL